MPVVIDSVNGITQASWTTAGRPGSPVAGQVGFNTSLNALEQYDGSGWETIPSWSTANRPVSPVAGYSGYNIDTKAFEFYNGTTWIGFNQSNLSTPASYLLIAGGGGGAAHSGAVRGGGGGGAGGLRTGTVTLTQATSYTITVGGGGTGTGDDAGSNGSNSVISGSGISTVTSVGGGVGRAFTSGVSGGSGGGGGYISGTGGAGTAGQGNNGGNGGTATGTTADAGGGGGGAGGVGGNGTSSGGGSGGTGGAGVASSISGSSVSYAGGGGGGNGNGNGGTATAGGGTGGSTGSAGTPNTGGGAGGKGTGAGGNGGSGIAIISYPGAQAFTGGLITSSGGNTIHTFTSSGTLTPLSGVLNINNSLRFRASASAYLNRTFATPTNNKIFTYSVWTKRGTLGANTALLSPASAGTGYTTLRFESNDQLVFQEFTGSVYNYQFYTTQVFRDPSSWYHIVVAVDTTQATASDRVKIYVNGSQVTAFATASYPTQNSNPFFNSAVVHRVGANNYIGNVEQVFDGYMANVQFIDGQALTPANFGNTDAYGNWEPVRYTGTYGTNGFYLTFADATLTSGANTGLGRDSSGNGNFWTTNNISVTAGTTYDAMIDVPTNTSATVANYPTLNPLSNTSTLTEANLSASNILLSGSTIATPSSGKWYFEYTQTTSIPSGSLWVGVSSNLNAIPDNQLQGYSYATDGRKVAYNSYTSGYGATWTNGDIIGCALDLDSATITFFKNGISQGVAFTGITIQPYVFALSAGGAPSTKGGSINFGQRPFAYTPPSGFVALNTFNLPTPTILQGNLYMDATLYTGTGSALTVVNQAGFRPDLVWSKNRSAGDSHGLYDSVRGVNQRLLSNLTNAEDTSSGVSAFNANGFSLGTAANYNTNGNNFVAWQWQAGSSTVTNTSGSISSQVRANTTAGFSIVTYTGTGANATVGHGLGVKPSMIIVRNRSIVQDWRVWNTNLTSGTGYLSLNLTDAAATATTLWNSLDPTSTVINLGTGNSVNGSGNSHVAYCWAQIAGFSAFGSYTGANNTGASTPNANGPFIYLGFRPKFVLIKRTSSAAQWVIYDSARGTFNANLPWLYPNAADAETATEAIDFLSNGFKIRSESGATMFPNGATFIYAAFAENPFKFSNAR